MGGSSARNQVPCLGCRSLLFLFASHLVRSSALPCLATSSPLACPPSLFSHLAVAVHLTRAGVLGSGSAVKPELGSLPISSSGIWTHCQPCGPSFGGRCGRASVVRPIGHQNHVSFVSARRQQTSPRVCSRGRGSPLRSPPNHAAHAPRTLCDSGFARGWWYWQRWEADG